MPDGLNLILHLSWYQLLGELLALILLVTSLSITISDYKKQKLWRRFIRSSSFLIAFASLAIPWMIKGVF